MKKYRNSMTRAARILTGAAMLAACAAQAQYTGPKPPEIPLPGAAADFSPANEFLRYAAQANQQEIAMANVAEARSRTPAVKELAQMMRADHQRNLAQLQVLAQDHLIALDPSLDFKSRRAVNRLQETSDADFDKEYTTAMLADHVSCIKTFDKALAEVDRPYALQYAQSTLPTLRTHLRHAENAARAVGVDEVTIASILKGLPSEDEERSVTFNR
jgi:putative membrane protein